MAIAKVSSLALGRALVSQPDRPIRALKFGRFVLTWDGKPGDIRTTVPTEELLGHLTTRTNDDRGGHS